MKEDNESRKKIYEDDMSRERREEEEEEEGRMVYIGSSLVVKNKSMSYIYIYIPFY